MSKLESIETIDSKTKTGEKIETVTPETIEIPNYEYGNGQNTLDAPVVLRNLDTVTINNNYIVKSGTYTAGITSLTTVSLTFTPKLVEFTFFVDTTWPTWSDGSIDDVGQQCLSRKYTINTNLIQQSVQALGFEVQEFLSSSYCGGTVSLITNGFTFQANSNTFAIDLKYIARCYG